jgi:hypothetical protein
LGGWCFLATRACIRYAVWWVPRPG